MKFGVFFEFVVFFRQGSSDNILTNRGTLFYFCVIWGCSGAKRHKVRFLYVSGLFPGDAPGVISNLVSIERAQNSKQFSLYGP